MLSTRRGGREGARSPRPRGARAHRRRPIEQTRRVRVRVLATFDQELGTREEDREPHDPGDHAAVRADHSRVHARRQATSSMSACDLVSPNICLPMPDGPMNTSSESRDLIRAPRLSGGDAPAAGCSSLRCVADVADMLNACVIRSAESYFATSRHRRCSRPRVTAGVRARRARATSAREAAGNRTCREQCQDTSLSSVRRQGSIEPSSVRASQCCVHYSSHRIHFRENTQRVDVGKGSTHTAHARFAR